MFDLFRWFLLLVDWKFVAIFWKQKMCLTTYKRARAIKGAVLCCRVRAHSSLWGSLGRKAARQVTRPKKETSRTLNLYSPLSLSLSYTYSTYLTYLFPFGIASFIVVWSFPSCWLEVVAELAGNVEIFAQFDPFPIFGIRFFVCSIKDFASTGKHEITFSLFVRSLKHNHVKKETSQRPPLNSQFFFSLPRIHIQRSRLSLSVNSNHFLADDRMMRFKYNRRKKKKNK